MTTIHTLNIPNGQKPVILLKELGLSYEIALVDIGGRAQDDASLRGMNPNGKIPALQDDELTIFESGAILLHLVETHGQFLF